MKWLKHHWRGLSRAVAVGLLGVGLFCGYWWFYQSAPFRRILDPEWYMAHSRRAYWAEVQKSIHRTGWSHDAGFTIGACGDESWMKWIMDHIEPGTRLDGCLGDGLAHADSALSSMSNQDVGHDANAWLDWWKKNRQKTQSEWISDGFRQRGVHIDVPPTPDQIPALLAMLGNSDTNQMTAIPDWMRHNAFRCLRDSGFEAVGYAISHRPPSPDIERGLLEYAKRVRIWPSADGVGILAFGVKEEVGWDDVSKPLILGTRMQILVNALVFGPLLAGTALLVLSCRKKRE